MPSSSDALGGDWHRRYRTAQKRLAARAKSHPTGGSDAIRVTDRPIQWSSSVTGFFAEILGLCRQLTDALNNRARWVRAHTAVRADLPPEVVRFFGVTTRCRFRTGPKKLGPMNGG